jgi:hypothetical protein
MTNQNALPPYTTRCLRCGKEWVPEPTKSGPNKGQHTDASLQKSSDQHMKVCRGDFFEEDEPVEDVRAAFDAGVKGRTTDGVDTASVQRGHSE